MFSLNYDYVFFILKREGGLESNFSYECVIIYKCYTSAIRSCELRYLNSYILVFLI